MRPMPFDLTLAQVLAFLPQFVPANSAHATAQSAVLGLLFAAQTVVVFGLRLAAESR